MARQGKGKHGGKGDARHQAEQFSRQLGQSAQEVWLAGVGAFGRAQAEGSKLFDTLVREGASVEQNTRKAASGGVDAMRDAVESRVGQARERATETWDRLERVFEDRVKGALRGLDVPSRDEVAKLSREVETLNAELRRQRASGAAGAAAPARKAAVRKAAPATRPAARANKVAKAPTRPPAPPPAKTSAKAGAGKRPAARKS